MQGQKLFPIMYILTSWVNIAAESRWAKRTCSFFFFFLVVILSLANIELIKVTKDYCSLREREREREREKERGDKGEWSSRGGERWRGVSGKEGSVEENQALRNSRGPTCLAGRHVVLYSTIIHGALLPYPYSRACHLVSPRSDTLLITIIWTPSFTLTLLSYPRSLPHPHAPSLFTP